MATITFYIVKLGSYYVKSFSLSEPSVNNLVLTDDPWEAEKINTQADGDTIAAIINGTNVRVDITLTPV